MGIERRRDPRIRCSIPCVLHVAGDSIEGKVRNVSASGLAVAADAPAIEQGDPVTVELRAEHSVIRVRGLVWHVRSSGRGVGEKNTRSFGLVLSDSAPEFAALVQRLGAKPPPSLPSPPEPTPSTPARSGAIRPFSSASIARARPAIERGRIAPVRAREYRIRIKQSGGPRTHQIVASGVSKEAAIAAALREVGQGWIVLEVALIA